MQKHSNEGARRSLLLTLFVLGLVTVAAILPYQFRTAAGGKGLYERTVSHEDAFPNYDIREQKGDEIADLLVIFRQASGKGASAIADTRDEFVRGEDELRSRVPTLKVEYNTDLRIPEVIGPDVWQERAFLTTPTTPSGARHAEVLLNFLKQNTPLVGASTQQIDGLKVAADYTNPDGNLSFVELNQQINGIPVFRGEVKAGFTKRGEMIRVINNLAPGLDYDSLSTNFGDPSTAVRAAFKNVSRPMTNDDSQANAAASNNLKTVFGHGDWATTAEKMYFPTELGVARAAWRVLIWQPVNAYYVIVDAETGTMLWRKNITDDQTQPATYSVYANSNSLIDVADSPAPITPGPIDPGLGTQGVQTARTNRTFIGNEGVLSFNNLGWITDGANGVNGFTDGNAVEAGVDLGTPNGVDAPVSGTARVFNFAFNPPPGLQSPPDALTTQASRDGAVTQLFYINNRYHDIMYQLGFTEAAKNFQNDNFGRNPGGGTANAVAGVDRVSAEAQDSSGTNNANFSTPADGGRGRMQMFRFTQVPNRDGDLDADVVIHEHTHGLSNRLIGNSNGAAGSRGMGEGWSDFYGLALESEPSDPINGIYSTGAYITFQVTAFGIGTDNSYYGIRRFPYAVRAFTGGPLNRPHNPLTFGDLNAGCNLSDGAFPPSFTGTCNEVHNAGEIWASMLWEVRARFVTRLGAAVGNRKTLQIVTDGMKLAPISGLNMQNSRDSIIAAAQASTLVPEASADASDVREGFRIRGLGFTATDNGTTAVEAFDVPNAVITNPFSVSDATGDNDGFPEPGEAVVLTLPVTNTTGATVNDVNVTLTGGATVGYGNVANGSTVTRTFNYTIPSGAVCGSLHSVTFTLTSDLGTGASTTRQFQLGKFAGSSNTTSIAIPDAGTGTPYPSNVTVSGISGTAAVRVRLNQLTHTFPGDIDVLLVGPGGQKMIVMSDTGSGSGVTNADIILEDAASANMPTGAASVAGTWKPTNTGTGDTFAAPAPAAPYETPAPAGTATFASVFGTTGSAMNGTWSLYVVDDAGGDLGAFDGGWSISFTTPDFTCSVASSNKAPFDFDGDRKTDISIFRPIGASGAGEWWYLKSTTGGDAASQFGASTDKLTPGDFTGDGKADFAYWKPSTGEWFVLRSEDFSFFAFPFGTNGDIPAPADYDGDGTTDAAVFRPSESTWYIRKSAGGTTIQAFGESGDVPVTADYDGDGKSDIAIYRPGPREWWLLRSTAGQITFQFGETGDKTVPGDYTGDGKADVAFYRPTTGDWFVLRSENQSFFSFPFGAVGDVPSPGDYDGDGKFDATVLRPSTNTWFVQRSTAGTLIQPFGQAGDISVPNAFVR